MPINGSYCKPNLERNESYLLLINYIFKIENNSHY